MKDLTRNLLMKLGLGVLTLSAVTSGAAIPFYFEYNLEKPEKSSEGYTSYFILAPGGKLSDTWKMSWETNIALAHADRTGKIAFTRLNFKNLGVAKLGDWNLDINYRYTAPFSVEQYSANNMGSIGIRPELSAKFGDFDALIRNTVGLSLSEKWKRAAGTAPLKSNSHLSNSLELIPNYTVNPEWSLSAYFLYNISYSPADFGQTNSGMNTRIIWDVLEVGYTNPSLDGWSLAATFENDTTHARKSTGSYLDSGNWSYILKASKAF